MKGIFVFLALVALSAAQLINFPIVDFNLDSLWDGYKTKFGKNYQTENNELARRLIWEKNVRHINKHNFESDLGQHSYSLGINEYTDMRADEFTKERNGLRFHDKNTHNASVVFVDENVSGLPAEVDWRKKGYVTQVKDQGHCGSCWAFAATGSLEGQFYRKTGKLLSFSEQDLIDCAGSCGTEGCNGGLIDPAYKCIKKFGGIQSEEDYPYEAKNFKCRFDNKKVVTTVSSYVDIKKNSEKALQKAVATIGPIAVAIDASHTAFIQYKNGIYSNILCTSFRLDHGVLVVGYGTENGQDYWLVKNSWGTHWGIGGYFKLARNEDNMCGIATLASYPVL